MIKVGLFIDTFYPMLDGVISVVNNYARRMHDGEFDVTVFCPQMVKGYVDDVDYRLERCKSIKFPFFGYPVPAPGLDSKFKKALEASELDIVHIHSPFMLGKVGLKYAKRHNIPIVATMHSQYKQDFYLNTHSKLLTNILTKNMVRLYDSCDLCCTVNDNMVKVLEGYGVKRTPSVLLNGTDYCPVEDKQAAIARVNAEFGLPEDIPVFLFLGRMTNQKNLPFLLDSAAKLKSDFRLLMVGDGAMLDELKKQAEKAGIADKVMFVGRITDKEMLKAIFCRVKLFLFPSLYDTSSLVQVEAASQGTPTLFLEGAPTSYGVVDGVNGYIAPQEPDAYAAKIEDILKDEAAYLAVRDGAFKDLYRSWDDRVNEVKAVYRELIAKKKEGK